MFDLEGPRVWAEVESELRVRFGSEDASLDHWLAMIRVHVGADHDVRIAVPNAFVQNWVERKYLGSIREILSGLLAQAVTVRVEIDATASPLATPNERMRSVDGSRRVGVTPIDPQPRFALETFEPGSSNQTVISAMRRVLAQPDGRFNPLVLYGATGLGKTHLLRALGAELRMTGSRVRFVRAETFLNEFVANMRKKQGEQFRARYRSPDVLIVDDLQVLAGKPGTQEEFLHTLDSLMHGGRQVVVAANAAPRRIPKLLPALAGRLVSGLVLRVYAPDLDARKKILRRSALSLPVPVPGPLLDYLAEIVRGSVNDVLGALHRVSIHAESQIGTLDRASVDRVLADVIAEERRRLSPQVLLEATASYYRLAPEVIRSRRRDRVAKVARGVAIYLCREKTDHSLAELSELFARSVSAVRSADRRLREAIQARPEIRQSIHEILEGLQVDPPEI